MANPKKGNVINLSTILIERRQFFFIFSSSLKTSFFKKLAVFSSNLTVNISNHFSWVQSFLIIIKNIMSSIARSPPSSPEVTLLQQVQQNNGILSNCMAEIDAFSSCVRTIHNTSNKGCLDTVVQNWMLCTFSSSNGRKAWSNKDV